MIGISRFLRAMLLVTLGCTQVHSNPLKVNCSSIQRTVTVPKIQLKYMLNGKLHVIWRENETTGYDYTAYICCSKVWSKLGSGCPSFCPKFLAMNSAGSGMGTGNCQSSLTVYAYLEYTVYLSGKRHGCDLMGKVAEFKPMLRTSPNPVPSLNIYSQDNGLLIEWTKSNRYVQLLYSIRCQQMNSTNNQQENLDKARDNVSKTYFCCVRVRLPYYGITPYYSQVCEVSKNEGITPKFHCGDSHECKVAVVNDLTDFAGQLMPSNANWPKVPGGMVIQISRQ